MTYNGSKRIPNGSKTIIPCALEYSGMEDIIAGFWKILHKSGEKELYCLALVAAIFLATGQ